ncbi:NAD(P)H oxidoreductase [Radiobacillus kanasensis]|uniref:NAD(P)H oxidoreductase n=1 Tax=Radiobacillus kanasensis TaxID=2844358 RepID=UPI001E34A58D|nr:NAD(P)H oxidoreductase [Radiobacillus kanasensis]UFT99739.1 NAD(P)H oxidoreductase [Radiobacillus kanasensis]
MKVLTIVTHPRKNSLTFQVANQFVLGLKKEGHEAEVMDLYQSNFDPVLRELDEPDWTSNQQNFSSEVEAEMEKLRKFDALAFVFPLWWWSMPAMLKGYIDRVWNYGFAYGPNKLTHKHVLWLSLAGAPIERFTKRRYDEMMERYFNVALADYCGIPSSRFELLYETISGNPEYMEDWLSQAYQLGIEYGK